MQRTSARALRAPSTKGLLFRAFLSDKLTVASASFLVVIIVAALVGPRISPYEGWQQNLAHSLVPPLSARDGNFYILGTDGLGRDTFTRLMEGARVSLSIGAMVVSLCGLLGTVLGLLAGFYRGWLDDLIMRAVDAFMALPTLFFLLVALYIVGPGTANIVIILAIARWMLYCRITRGLVLSLREQDFTIAARVIGASDVRIMRVHILPNAASPLLTVAFMDVARVILIESSLSFLGMGIQPPEVSWGLMVATGRNYLATAWWLSTIPGITIFLTTLSVNLCGLWLRAVNDPLQRWRWLNVRMEKS